MSRVHTKRRGSIRQKRENRGFFEKRDFPKSQSMTAKWFFGHFWKKKRSSGQCASIFGRKNARFLTSNSLIVVVKWVVVFCTKFFPAGLTWGKIAEAATKNPVYNRRKRKMLALFWGFGVSKKATQKNTCQHAEKRQKTSLKIHILAGFTFFA